MGKRALGFGFLVLPPVPSPALPPLPARASGDKNAPIVFEVYSDLQCPGCRELYLRSRRRVLDEYCATGKVYLVHHEVPRHTYSRPATEWAIAASTIGKYEAACEALFSKQDQWGASGKIEPVIAAILTPAELKKVKAAMVARKGEISAAIDEDVRLSKELPIGPTPTLKVINKGKIVLPLTPGIPQYTILKRFLDDQLAK